MLPHRFLRSVCRESKSNKRYAGSAVVTLCTVLFMALGCEKEPTYLNGTVWKLAGIVSQTGELKKLEPVDCEKCYTLTFETDYKCTATSITRSVNLNLRKLRPPSDIEKMLLCERYDKDGETYCDSDKFYTSIILTKSYSTSSDELKLFVKHNYGGVHYLSFVPYVGKNP